MSTLVYDGAANTITLLNNEGESVGSWPAHNRVERAATIRYVPNGTYHLADRSAPHRHAGSDRHGPLDSANGAYGAYGIVRLNPFQGHAGIGVHSGRANLRDGHGNVGPKHVTQGCIRTTDDAMSVISRTMHSDPLDSIIVRHNAGR